jgi:hypothetical protein
LGGGKENDREGSGVFDSVVKGLFALVRGQIVFYEALT